MNKDGANRALSAYSQVLQRAAQVYGRQGNASTQVEALMLTIAKLKKELGKTDKPERVAKLLSLIARNETLIITLAPRVLKPSPEAKQEDVLLPNDHVLPNGRVLKRVERNKAKAKVVEPTSDLKPTYLAKRRKW